VLHRVTRKRLAVKRELIAVGGSRLLRLVRDVGVGETGRKKAREVHSRRSVDNCRGASGLERDARSL